MTIGVVIPPRTDLLASWKREIAALAVAHVRGSGANATEIEKEIRAAQVPFIAGSNTL